MVRSFFVRRGPSSPKGPFGPRGPSRPRWPPWNQIGKKQGLRETRWNSLNLPAFCPIACARCDPCRATLDSVSAGPGVTSRACWNSSEAAAAIVLPLWEELVASMRNMFLFTSLREHGRETMFWVLFLEVACQPRCRGIPPRRATAPWCHQVVA